MDFTIKTGLPDKLRTNCLILAVYESGKLPETTAAIDRHVGGIISKSIKSGDIQGKLGQTLVLFNVSGISAERILLLGCGKPSELNAKAYRDISQKMASAMSSLNIRDAISAITELPVTEYDISWKVQQAIVSLGAALYKFDEFKSKAERSKNTKAELKKVTWLVTHRKDVTDAEYGVKVGQAINTGIKLTRDLGNTPPNICNPSYMAKAAQKLAKDHKSVSVAVLDQKQLKTLKMGALLAVGQGSAQPPKLVTIEYRGAAKTQQPVVLVGKGITFDTGGNSLKPAANMIGMKYDMCGAATVLGAIKFAAELNLAINLVGVLAVAENMPGGTASRPDDVITTMAGITVEILNTDAEGRLVLSDALAYCERFNPKVVIDIATLTSACIVALGNHHSALFTNHQPLADELIAAGIVSGDKCWQMPLTDEYQRQLDSNCADLANVGGSEAGSITAACFLSRFTKKYQWAHLDVAGTACKFTGKDRTATGQPLPLLAEYLMFKTV